MDHSMSGVAHYDFIVVGGGIAGSVVAARLVEDPTISVLVVKARPNYTNDFRANTPGMLSSSRGSEIDWQFKSTPQVV
jgi:choline dehydrogenase